MNNNHQSALNSLYSYCKFNKKHGFTAEEIESFLNGILKDKLSKQKIGCLFKALDRDEDNLILHYEFEEAIYGA